MLSFLVVLVLLLNGCKPSDKSNPADASDATFIEYNNAPAEGFNAEDSDPVAIMLADQVMNSMGGRAAWDEANAFYWNFFGARMLLWDKDNNRVRVYIPDSKTTIALDMNEMSGNVWKNGEKMENPDSVSTYLQKAKEIWINDSYWLFMPFKLKDSGVTLKYVREDTTMAGEKADVLRLTFDNVGVTPDNAYEVWIDFDDKLVKQWAWFKEAGQEEPNFVLPWTDYKDHNGLLLSGERGDRDITDIKVLKKVPKGAFDKPGKLD